MSDNGECPLTFYVENEEGLFPFMRRLLNLDMAVFRGGKELVEGELTTVTEKFIVICNEDGATHLEFGDFDGISFF